MYDESKPFIEVLTYCPPPCGGEVPCVRTCCSPFKMWNTTSYSCEPMSGIVKEQLYNYKTASLTMPGTKHLLTSQFSALNLLLLNHTQTLICKTFLLSLTIDEQHEESNRIFDDSITLTLKNFHLANSYAEPNR